MVGPGVEETARFSITATPESSFARIVSHPNRALRNSSSALLCFILGAADEGLPAPLPLVALAYRQMTDFPLIPLKPLNIHTGYNRAVFEVKKVVACLFEYCGGGVLHRKPIALWNLFMVLAECSSAQSPLYRLCPSVLE